VKSFSLFASFASLVSVSLLTPTALAEDAGADAGKSGAVGRDAGSLLDAGDGASRLPDAAPLAPPTHAVGKACTKDSDCTSGTTCMTATTDSFGTGGPAGGVCTISCSKNFQDDCNKVDTGSICASETTGKFQFCYESCEFGTLEGGATKCHDRDDMACSPSQASSSGYCAPTCRGDSDCQDGRKCEPRTGLCSLTVAGALPVGSACDPNASESNCIGTCATLSNGVATTGNSFCTERCALDRDGACGQPSSGSGTLGCVFSFNSSEGTGDVGECGQLCDCDSDCSNPGFICSTTANADKVQGRSGLCVPKLTFNGVTPGSPCDAGIPTPVTDSGASTSADASTRTDAGSDGGKSVAVSASGGCSCRTTGSGSPARAPAVLALGLGALALRRRAASKKPRRQG
jgi:MYXO-CTERM domain-containing protein